MLLGECAPNFPPLPPCRFWFRRISFPNQNHKLSSDNAYDSDVEFFGFERGLPPGQTDVSASATDSLVGGDLPHDQIDSVVAFFRQRDWFICFS